LTGGNGSGGWECGGERRWTDINHHNLNLTIIVCIIYTGGATLDYINHFNNPLLRSCNASGAKRSQQGIKFSSYRIYRSGRRCSNRRSVSA
jgi:hypothetical protein